jgi:hypothetical protein
VLAPISTEGLTVDDVASLRERTRDAIADALVELRAELGLVRAAPRTAGPSSAELPTAAE